jgi:hypothetical protein
LAGNSHCIPSCDALLEGWFVLAVSTEILLEYEEITVKLSGAERWRDVAAFLELLTQLHGNIRQIEPHYLLTSSCRIRTTTSSATAQLRLKLIS